MIGDPDNRDVTIAEAVTELETRTAFPPRDLVALIEHGVVTNAIGVVVDGKMARWSEVQSSRSLGRPAAGGDWLSAGTFSVWDDAGRASSASAVVTSQIASFLAAGHRMSMANIVLFLSPHVMIHPAAASVAIDQELVPKPRGGRKPDHDWDGAHLDLVRHLDENGLPSPLVYAELERWMAEWFDRHYRKTPVESAIRTAVKKAIEAFQAQRRRQAMI